MKEKFDFSKIKDQHKFEKLQKEEQQKIIDEAENKSGTKGGIIEVFAHGSGFKF